MPHITHIALWTQNLEPLRDFYQRWFGAASNQKYTNPTTGFQSYFLSFDQGARLEIMTAPEVLESSSEKLTGYAHIAFSLGSEEEVRSLTARMQAAGTPVASPARTTGDGFYESVVLDPDGNHVELTV
jgi:lactoylglutathione lyase